MTSEEKLRQQIAQQLRKMKIEAELQREKATRARSEGLVSFGTGHDNYAFALYVTIEEIRELTGIKPAGPSDE